MTANPRLIGRILALLTLVLIISGVFAQGFVSNRLIDFSNAATTANNILAHKGLFQLGFTVFLIEMACNVANTALWYVLLRPVNRSLALVAAFIDLAGAVFKTFARVFFIAPLWVLLHTGSPARWFSGVSTGSDSDRVSVPGAVATGSVQVATGVSQSQAVHRAAHTGRTQSLARHFAHSTDSSDSLLQPKASSLQANIDPDA